MKVCWIPAWLVVVLLAFTSACGGGDCDNPNPNYDASDPSSQACLDPVPINNGIGGGQGTASGQFTPTEGGEGATTLPATVPTAEGGEAGEDAVSTDEGGEDSSIAEGEGPPAAPWDGPNPEGSFFMALAFFQDEAPLQFHSKHYFYPNEDGTGILEMTWYPLTTDQGSLDDAPYVWGSDGQGIPVDENGEFETTFPGFFSTLPGMFGAASLLSQGVDGIDGLTLRGQVVSHDLICGEAQGTFLLDGEPLVPFDFGQSTFAATRLDSDVLNNYDGPYPTFGEDMLLGCPSGD